MFVNKQKIMQWKKKQPSQSIKKDTNISSATQQQPSATNSISWSLYRSIYELPLSKYIDCIVDGNLSALIREGYPPEQDIILAWNTIMEQDSAAAGDAEYHLYFSLFKRIAILTTDLNAVHKLVEILSFMYHEPLAKELNLLLKTNFKFNAANQEEYQSLLKRCINRSKAMKIELDMKIIQYEEMEKKLVKNEKPTREYFFNILISLSDHAGYDIRAENITVYEYRERLRRLKKYAENLKSKKR
jgi:hypothetical protein